MPDLIVFISYRRADTRADAGRLYDALRRRFGRDSLFMDVDSVSPGVDWVAAIESAIAQCDVLLAVIGSDWTSVRDEAGNLRLEDESDHVRLEIEEALKADKPVIPILFDDAHMPGAAELPASLQPLLRRQAIQISHATFESDLAGLVHTLRKIRQRKLPQPKATVGATSTSTQTALASPPVWSPPSASDAPVPGPPIAPPQTVASTVQGRSRRALLIGAIGVGALAGVILLGAIWAAAAKPLPSPSATIGAPPQGSLQIAGDRSAALTTQPHVTLAIPATAAAGAVVKVRVANSGEAVSGVLSDASAQTLDYQPSIGWQLSSGDGQKAVFVQWQDSAGLWSTPVSASISLDSPPIALDDLFDTDDACTTFGYMLLPVFRNDLDPAGGKRFDGGAPFLTRTVGPSEEGHGTPSPTVVIENGEALIRYDCIDKQGFSDAFDYTIYDAADSEATAHVTLNVPLVTPSP